MHTLSISRRIAPLRGALELLLIFAVGLFIYGWKLGNAPLDRTEPHRALVAHQMVTSGQWLIPKLFGEIYLRKPPLIYWIEGATEKLIGHGDEFVWRLPSAVGSAILAVVLAAWSARWFGSFARLPAGIACLALVALWEQNRGADIDALNTAASVVTAMLVLELLYGERSISQTESSRSLGTNAYFIWLSAFSLSLASTLLLKGPGGLPPILGALMGPSILLHDWKWLRRTGIWIAILTGITIFASYGVVAKAVLRHQGIVADTGGLREAMQRLFIHRIGAIGPALLAPVTTLAYSLPVSAVIAICFVMLRGLANRKVTALLGTIGGAFVIWIIAGNDNPRYEYVALPLLAPLVGAVAVGWHKGNFTSTQQNIMRWMLGGFAAMLAGIAIVIAALIWKRSNDHVALAAATGVAAISGIVGVGAWVLSSYRSGATAVVLAMMSLAIPLGDRKNLDRQRRSARAVAEQLRQIVHDQPVGVVSMNRDMPEMFYYAGLSVKTYGERGLDKLAAAPGGQWVVLSQNRTFPEYGTLTSQIPSAFPRGVQRLKMPSDKDVVYVGWYEPPAGISRMIRLPSILPGGALEDEE